MKLFRLLPILLITLNLSAQKITYTASEEQFKVHHGMNGWSSEHGIVQVNGGYIALTSSMTANWYNNDEPDKEVKLTFLDKAMVVKSEKDVEKDVKNTHAISLMNAGGHLYYIYSTQNSKAVKLYTAEVNPVTMEVSGSQLLIEFPFHPDRGNNHINIINSVDSSKYIFLMEHITDRGDHGSPEPKETQTIKFAVTDKSMKKIYEKDYAFPYNTKEMRMKGFVAGNDGSLNLVYYYYSNGDKKKETVKVDGHGTPAYEVRVKRIDNAGDKEFNISINDKFLRSWSIISTGEGKFLMGGTYSDDNDDDADGAFMIKFSSSDKTAMIKTFPIPDEITKQFHNHADFGEGNPYRMSIISRLNQRVHVLENNNTVYIFSQYFWTTGGGNVSEVEHDGDVLLTVIPSDGNPVFTNLGMREDGNKLNADVPNIFFRKEQLWFVAGSVEKNNKTTSAVIMLDKNGKVVNNVDVYRSSDIGGYSCGNALSFNRFSDSQYMMSARDGWKVKYVLFNIEE